MHFYNLKRKLKATGRLASSSLTKTPLDIHDQHWSKFLVCKLLGDVKQLFEVSDKR